MFKRILVAGRGEIALRILRTAHECGIEVVAVYSDVDRDALHVRRADIAVPIGGPAPSESYLRGDEIIAVAKRTDVSAIHPGYGFLAENAGFARAVAGAGLVLIGPPAEAMEAMGDKLSARKIAAAAGVPIVPGTAPDAEPVTPSAEELAARAREIGFPVMLKASAGGGGKGIRIVRDQAALAEAVALVQAEAKGAFGDDTVYLEKFLVRPRHVEIQVMADQHGNVVCYGERECSVQRRHQKLVEESPSLAVDDALRGRMQAAACDLARAVGYVGAGTVEFMVSEGEFYFLEMNTRLQVEHPITEERFGVDLVLEQLRVASGEKLAPVGEPHGHSIEVRINAEDPDTFLPSLGVIRAMSLPGGSGVRIDSALYEGLEITPWYDSMLAKLIVHAQTRTQAIERMRRALSETRIVGVKTSIPIAYDALDDAGFREGDYDTSILDTLERTEDAGDFEIAALGAALFQHLGLGAGARPSVRVNGQPRQDSAWLRSARTSEERAR